MSKEETPILPQAAAFLVISYLVYRYFFTSSTGTSSAAAPSAPTRRIDPRRLQQQVEAVHGMFPQIPQAAIETELIRNGGNIEVATERILSTGFLPDPPRNATSPAATTTAATPTMHTGTRPSRAAQAGPSAPTPRVGLQYTDLITRYNLHGRLAETAAAEEDTFGGAAGKGKGKAPANKQDRLTMHQTKRDDMILAARRRVEKMIAKENSMSV